LETKVKTALTKAYNNSDHRSQVLMSEKSTKSTAKKGGGASVVAAGPLLNEEGFLDEDLAGELDQDQDQDEMEVVDKEGADDLTGIVVKAKRKANQSSATKKKEGGASKSKKTTAKK
jgi:hypothetical protein